MLEIEHRVDARREAEAAIARVRDRLGPFVVCTIDMPAPGVLAGGSRARQASGPAKLPSHDASKARPMSSYAFRILPCAEPWSAVEPDEATLLAHYLKHLQRLRRGGSVRLIGQGQNGGHAVLLVDAQDELHARTIARSDPAVSEGLMRIARRASLVVHNSGTGHHPTAQAPPEARLGPTARQP